MARYPGLWLRGSRWQLRVVVPKDLRQVFEKAEINKSLGTSDRRAAIRLYLEERSEIERQFAAARDGLEGLSEADIRGMVTKWFDGEDRRWAEADHSTFGNGQRDALDDARDWEGMLQVGEDEEAMPHVQTVADAILIGNGFPGRPHRVGKITAVGVQVADVDKSSGKYWSLVAQVRRSMLEAARRHHARLRGGPAGQAFDPAFVGVGAGVAGQDIPPANRVPSAAPPLTEIIGMWKAERKPSRKTEDEWTTSVRRFTDVCGDLPVDAITKAHVRTYRDVLLRTPRRLSHRARTMRLPDLVASVGDDPGVQRISPSTVKKCVGAIAALLEWAVENDHAGSNPARGVKVRAPKSNGDGRLPYTTDDLNLIFGSSPVFTRGDRPRSGGGEAAFWLPLLALFTGARLEELGQALVSDLKRDGTIDYRMSAFGGEADVGSITAPLGLPPWSK